MRRFGVLALAAALLLGLGARSWAAPGGNKFPPKHVPRFHIPRAAQSPQIDGRIGAEEWADAVQLQGVTLVGELAYFGRDVRFWWAWDEQHLYLAARSGIREGERLVKQHRQRRTMGVVHDDAYEFGIDLSGRNRASDEAPFFHKFILNSVGAGEYQKVYPSIGQNLYNWAPEFDIANRRWTDENGKRWWDMEVAMDLSDLEMPRAHQAGDRLKLLMARDFKHPWKFAHMPSATQFLEHRGFPRAELVADEPFAQIETLEGLLDKRVRLRARLTNPGESAVELEAALHVRSRAGEEPRSLWRETQSFTLKPGASAVFAVDRAVEAEKASLDLDIARVGAGRGADDVPIYRYHVRFSPDAEKQFLEYDRDLPSFPLTSRFNPVTNKLWLAGDTLDAQVDGRDRIAGLKWRVTGDGRTLAEGRFERSIYRKYQGLIELPDLEPGQYQIEASLIDESGDKLLTRSKSFTKKDESEAFNEWWNNDIGSPDQMLRPFEPIEVSRSKDTVTLSPVLRDYRLDALGLPRGIQSNGGAVLNAPARIVVVTDGRSHVVPTDGTVEVTRREPWRVHFKGEATGAGLRFKVKGQLAQDGLVDLRLTYQPVDGPVEVQALRLEWPVDDSLNNHMVVIGPGGNYAAREVGAVPEGQGQVWDSLRALGPQASGMTKGDFFSNLWVGTEKRGLLWAGDSDEGWVPSNESPAHSLVRRGSTLIVRNHLITTVPGDAPYKLDASRTVRFQYNASPFRPLDRGFRVNLRSAGGGFGGKPGYMLNPETGLDGWHLLHPPTPDKDKWSDWYARWREKNEPENKRGLYGPIRRQKNWNVRQIPVRGYGPKSLEPGVYEYFGADWGPPGSGRELLTETYTDYTVHLMDRMTREAHTRQFYFDIAHGSVLASNLTGGHGYQLPDGRVQPEAADDELRHYAMRTYAMMQEHGIYPTGVTGHATNAFCLKALPFFDAMLDSEYPMEDSIDVFPSDRMIAMSCPHNFGVGINHLKNMDPRWAALHDASMSGASAFRDETFDHPDFRHWGITRDDVTFVPYWRNDEYISRIVPGLKATLWTRPHAVILGVVNYGPDEAGFEQKRPIRMRLDLETIGLDADDAHHVRVSEFMPPKDQPALKNLAFDPGTGALTGDALAYHDIRFIALRWEQQPLGDWQDIVQRQGDRRALLDWGINRARRVAVSRGQQGAPVRVQNDNLKAQAWRNDGSVLLRLENLADDATVAGRVALDLDALGIKIDPASQRWRRFYQLYDVDGRRNVDTAVWKDADAVQPGQWRKGAVKFDGYLGLVGARLRPGQVRYVSIDRY